MNGMGLLKKVVKQEVIREVEVLTKHRVYAYGSAGAGTSLAASTAVYISLLSASDDPNYDNVTDGSTIANCQIGSKVTSIQLFLVWKADAARMHEIMLFKDFDAEISTITPAANGPGVSDRSELNDAAKRSMMGYSPYYLTSNADARPRGIPVSGPALMRNRVMHEGDIIKLALFNNGLAASTWWLFGNINSRL